MREITALPFLLRMDTRNPRMMKKEKMMILHRNIKLSISPSISFFILFVSIPCYLVEFDCYRRWNKNCLYNSLLKDFASVPNQRALRKTHDLTFTINPVCAHHSFMVSSLAFCAQMASFHFSRRSCGIIPLMPFLRNSLL